MLLLAGGAEASICEVGIAGFENMKALCTSETDKNRASIPFDKQRNGFVMGEGSWNYCVRRIRTCKTKKC